MNKYLIQLTDLSYKVEFRSDHPPDPTVLKSVIIPPGLYDEDVRWLQIEDVAILEEMVPTATVNEVEKTTQQDLDSAAAVAKANADAHQALIDVKLKRQEFGKTIKAEVAVLNDSKGWNVAQTVAYMGNSTVKQLDALATAGSLQSLKDTMEAADLSAFYDSAEKQTILDLIQNYLDAE